MKLITGLGNPGDKYKVIDLLKGVAMASANDAVVALAEKTYGSKEHFIEYIVNQKLFSNLVQYVKENGKYPKQDEKVIIEEYKKLIGEYYDLVKK